MRQQVGDLMVFLRRQPRDHVLQIGVRIVAIEPRRLDQTHDGGDVAASIASSSRLACPGFSCSLRLPYRQRLYSASS